MKITKCKASRLKCILMVTLVFTVCFVQAKVTLPSVFSDNMLLQQKTDAAIWGKAEPGKAITISTSWNKKKYDAKADAKGDWKIKVVTPSYGGPYVINISDGELLSIKNVMIGEVWVCSGQSNMEMALGAGWGKINNSEKEIADASYPNIRLLQVVQTASNVPLDDVKVANGGWQTCSPEYIANFSATAYFFARDVYRKTKIPIGLIHTSWGGTIAEAWTSGSSLKTMPDFVNAVNQMESANKLELKDWLKLTVAKDAGYRGGEPIWSTNNLDVSSWRSMELPVYWEKAGHKDFDGVVWFRQKITIPNAWEGKDLYINLGPVDDYDITWFNGVQVGTMSGAKKDRKYLVPGNLVKAGENNITIRVLDSGGKGGVYGEANQLSLTSSVGNSLPLAGKWRYEIGMNLTDVPPIPLKEEGPNRVTVLFNAMINPFLQYAIRGAIWYQGESNTDRAYQYRELFPLMIKDWREKWNIGDFPFYFVQLANWMETNKTPGESAWAELREAQQMTLSLPNTGMAVIIDIGDAVDIHPKNKQDVGGRLALIAEAKVYGKKVNYSGPIFESQKIEGQKVRLKFKFSETGLKSGDGKDLTGFAVAGADKKFYWATASIAGNEVVLSCKEVSNPVAVRYGWANNPICNLYNGAGLPASPFRTDSWNGVTYVAPN